MHGRHQYDGDLQMFVTLPRNLDTEHLRFWRWLAESGRLEHDVAGPVGGPFAELARQRAAAEVPLAA